MNDLFFYIHTYKKFKYVINKLFSIYLPPVIILYIEGISLCSN